MTRPAMDPRDALMNLVLVAVSRALVTLAPARVGATPTPDGPPDAEALVRLYYEIGGDHAALMTAISRLRFIDHEAGS
ncbi:hypothetical protein [Roseospira visakhapatnamensis]|uniref:Uncharacterized protein n=1 Tax=Roseospira visakhapatnamensis TaxID=390880 RepID=A0A7W6RG26_9PROT|nr:hypothetical protein [Roseospira visakhapatnamensis]MBB4267787.1 hypothetical protein [Roseospira visakhapatnamensis]